MPKDASVEPPMPPTFLSRYRPSPSRRCRPSSSRARNLPFSLSSAPPDALPPVSTYFATPFLNSPSIPHSPRPLPLQPSSASPIAALAGAGGGDCQPEGVRLKVEDVTKAGAGGGDCQPEGVRLKVEDVTKAVLYLGSNESKYVTRVNLMVDGAIFVTKFLGGTQR